MGGAVSQEALSNHRTLLQRLSGPVPINFTNVFWKQLTSFPVALVSLDPFEVENFIAPFVDELVNNNGNTQSLQKLLMRLVGILGSAREPEEHRQAANALYLVRVLIKILLEKLPGPAFLSLLEAQQQVHGSSVCGRADPRGPLQKFVGALLDTLVRGNVSGHSYVLQLEVIRTLLVGCSSQLYTPAVAGPVSMHPVLDCLMSRKDWAGVVIQTLLTWFIKRAPPPADVILFKGGMDERPSVFRYVRNAAATALGTLFWLPSLAYQLLVRTDAHLVSSPLADCAQLLLLALVYHSTPSTNNPYKEALGNVQDVAFLGGNELNGHRQSARNVPTTSYGALYEAISTNLIDERSALLLYSLLQMCRTFQDYVLVRGDLETLMLPILRLTYLSSSKSQSQLYLLVIIILILSQDSSFGNDIHKLPIPAPDWYKDRAMGKTTLGSLLIVVLLRTATHNLAKMRDVYLHTNTIAALSNLATSVSDLSPHAAQRLVSLLDLLFRKYDKAVRRAGSTGGVLSDVEMSPELQFYADFLRILLEIINGIVTTNLPGNTELVYSILHRQGAFGVLQRYPQFTDLLENIQNVIEYFNTRIDEARALQASSEWGANKVLEVVRTTSRSWRADRLRMLPEVKFLYEEEPNPEEFFVPLVWSLIVTHSDLVWNPAQIVLFSPKTPTSSIQGSEDLSVTLETALYTPQHRSQLNGIQEIEENI